MERTKPKDVARCCSRSDCPPFKRCPRDVEKIEDEKSSQVFDSGGNRCVWLRDLDVLID